LQDFSFMFTLPRELGLHYSFVGTSRSALFNVVSGINVSEQTPGTLSDASEGLLTASEEPSNA
jgi:hypothetical protein